MWNSFKCLSILWVRDMFQVPGLYEVKDPASWGTYRTEIPTDEPLTRLDLNPLLEARKVQIMSISLKDLIGEVLMSLDFTSP